MTMASYSATDALTEDRLDKDRLGKYGLLPPTGGTFPGAGTEGVPGSGILIVSQVSGPQERAVAQASIRPSH